MFWRSVPVTDLWLGWRWDVFFLYYKHHLCVLILSENKITQNVNVSIWIRVALCSMICYASNYLVLDISVASVVVRSLNKCPQNWLSTRKISFHDTFMIFIIITINNVMIIITLCPEATSSCNRCFFNVRCPCQPNHRSGTSGTRLPHHHQATWHVPGPGDTRLGTRRMCGAGGDWTGLGSTLFCCVPSWFICCWPAPGCGWHSASAALASAGRTNIKHMAGPSLHPFITRLANMLDHWTRVHQPRYLDVTVASPCLFIFIQLAWTHNTALPPPPPPARRTKSWLKCLN